VVIDANALRYGDITTEGEVAVTVVIDANVVSLKLSATDGKATATVVIDANKETADDSITPGKAEVTERTLAEVISSFFNVLSTTTRPFHLVVGKHR